MQSGRAARREQDTRRRRQTHAVSIDGPLQFSLAAQAIRGRHHAITPARKRLSDFPSERPC